jgi:hypothetical protein
MREQKKPLSLITNIPVLTGLQDKIGKIRNRGQEKPGTYNSLEEGFKFTCGGSE